MNNSALFLAMLNRIKMPYKMKSINGGAMFAVEFTAGDMDLTAHIAIYDDDYRVRIVVGHLFHYEKDEQDSVLDILNFALEERKCATAVAVNGQVALRREISAGDDFNPSLILKAIDRMKDSCVSLVDKLELLNRPLS